MFLFFETKPEREATLLSIKHQNLSTIEETQHQIKERMSRLVTLFSVSCQLLHSKLHFEIGEGGAHASAVWSTATNNRTKA